MWISESVVGGRVLEGFVVGVVVIEVEQGGRYGRVKSNNLQSRNR